MQQSDIELVGQPIPQVDKLYAVLDQIEADPTHWDQTNWSWLTEDCGTTMCFAGWACKLEGLKLAVEYDKDNYCAGQLLNGDSIEEEARHVLGLTSQEAYDLFLGTLVPRYDYLPNERQEVMLERIKVEVARISSRAKEQLAAFERVAKELIESVPELEDVLKPGYLCPESQKLVLAHLGGRGGDN